MKNFVIVAELRSGYQMLATSLNSHPGIFCFGEIFGSDKAIRKKSLFNQQIPVLEDNGNPVNYIKNVLSTYAKNKGLRAVGFKLNYVCARKPDWRCLWDHVREEQWSVIHLTRNNLLNRMTSQLLADQENNWSFQEYKTTVEITPEHFLFAWNRSREWQQNLREEMKGVPILEVTYEDMDESPQGIFNEVQYFLEVKPKALKIPMVKQQTKRQSEVISNYRELYSYVMENRPDLAHYFEDTLFI